MNLKKTFWSSLNMKQKNQSLFFFFFPRGTKVKEKLEGKDCPFQFSATYYGSSNLELEGLAESYPEAQIKVLLVYPYLWTTF